MRQHLISMRLLLALALVSLQLAFPTLLLAASLEDFLTPSDQTPLPRDQYVEVPVRRLLSARVVWVNWELMKEYGIDVPTEGLTPEFEQRLLETFAWVAAKPGDRDANLSAESRLLYADRYGGQGRGSNLGSGRAASFLGRIPVQSKGVGRTQLVRATTADHSNGRLPMTEAYREAIFGEVNAKQLPHGANRVLLIIDCGTETVAPDGKKMRDSIVIRQDPLRPAHFMKVDSEFKRLFRTETITKFASAMGVARSQADSGRALFDVFNAYVERVAEQYARAFALRLYHGATTASNFEVNGRYLDYGTETAQPAHGKVYVLEHIEPAGETAEVVRDLITEFAEELNERTLSFWSQASIESFASHFQRMYDLRYREEFFALLGWPQELANELKSTKEARELGGLLGDLATKGAKPYLGRFVDPHAKVTAYDFASFASHLVSGDLSAENSRAKLIEKLGLKADEPLVSRIEELYSQVLHEARRIASTKSIPADNLQRFMKENVQLRNAPTPALYRWNLIPASESVIEKYIKTGSAAEFQKAIDSSIRSSLRLLPDSAIWERVASGSSRRRSPADMCSALFARAL